MSRKEEVQSYLKEALENYELTDDEVFYIQKCYDALYNGYDLDKSLFELRTKFSALALENQLSKDGITFFTEICSCRLGHSVSAMWHLLVNEQ